MDPTAPVTDRRDRPQRHRDRGPAARPALAPPVPLSSWLGGQVIPGLPRQLWVRGQSVADLGPRVAVVGARAASREGLAFAHELGERLAAVHHVVVSGGALGIDGAAHEGALAAGGVTVAVLGTGVDICYPVRHTHLFERICHTGALLSPLPPGTGALAWHFPFRNPVIAALGDAVVIVEAGAASGSLGTALAASRLGRPLWARPGSPGCDELIVSGRARAALSVDQLLEELLGRVAAPPPLPAELCELHTALGRAPAGADALSAQLGRALPEVLAALCELELMGRAIRLEDGRYLALPRAADLKE
jgi:DNA processing protein